MKELIFNPKSPWLAPLAGYSDLPFRLLCREYGASVCCTEMISAKGLVYNSPGTNDLLKTVLADEPLVLQLFGNEEYFMSKAMEILLNMGFCYFDLNMGCSVPKVTKSGSGAAMLKDINASMQIAKAMIDMAGKQNVGFKIRLGWDKDSAVWEDLGIALAEAGAGWLTLHPRYARQGFKGFADWDALKILAQKISIPLIASGDLLKAQDGLRCLNETKVSTLMYARGAMKDPAIFLKHKLLWADNNLIHSKVQVQAESGCAEEIMCLQENQMLELKSIILRHVELACQYGNEQRALFKMRSCIPRYVKYIAGASYFRQALNLCTNWVDFHKIVADFFEKKRI